MYNGDYRTDWHLHILLVSKPSYAFRNVIKEYIDKNWIEVPNVYEVEPFYIGKLGKKKVYKKDSNIKMADYFIAQSEDVLFCNCNFGEEEDLKYSLKDYYREYLTADSKYRKYCVRLAKKWMSEDNQLKELEKINSKFKTIEKYYYDMTKEQDEKEAKAFKKRDQLDKIADNYNKEQNIHHKRTFDESPF